MYRTIKEKSKEIIFGRKNHAIYSIDSDNNHYWETRLVWANLDNENNLWSIGFERQKSQPPFRMGGSNDDCSNYFSFENVEIGVFKEYITFFSNKNDNKAVIIMNLNESQILFGEKENNKVTSQKVVFEDINGFISESFQIKFPQITSFSKKFVRRKEKWPFFENKCRTYVSTDNKIYINGTSFIESILINDEGKECYLGVLPIVNGDVMPGRVTIDGIEIISIPEQHIIKIIGREDQNEKPVIQIGMDDLALGWLDKDYCWHGGRYYIHCANWSNLSIERHDPECEWVDVDGEKKRGYTKESQWISEEKFYNDYF